MRAPPTRPCAGSIAGPFAAVFPRQCHSAHRQRAAPQRQLTRTSVAALENPATQLSSSLSNGAAEPLEFDEVDVLYRPASRVCRAQDHGQPTPLLIPTRLILLVLPTKLRTVEGCACCRFYSTSLHKHARTRGPCTRLSAPACLAGGVLAQDDNLNDEQQLYARFEALLTEHDFNFKRGDLLHLPLHAQAARACTQLFTSSGVAVPSLDRFGKGHRFALQA